MHQNSRHGKHCQYTGSSCIIRVIFFSQQWYPFQATNSYHPDNSPANIYKPNQCIQRSLMTRILKYCKCYLDYIGKYKAKNPRTRTDRSNTRQRIKRFMDPCSKSASRNQFFVMIFQTELKKWLIQLVKNHVVSMYMVFVYHSSSKGIFWNWRIFDKKILAKTYVCVDFDQIPETIERFKRDDSRCPHACNSFQFHMENLHVISFNS